MLAQLLRGVHVNVNTDNCYQELDPNFDYANAKSRIDSFTVEAAFSAFHLYETPDSSRLDLILGTLINAINERARLPEIIIMWDTVQFEAIPPADDFAMVRKFTARGQLIEYEEVGNIICACCGRKVKGKLDHMRW